MKATKAEAVARKSNREKFEELLSKLPPNSYAASFALAWFDQCENRRELWFVPTGNPIEDARDLAERVQAWGSDEWDDGERSGREDGRKEGEEFAERRIEESQPPCPECAVDRADLEYRRRFPWRVAEFTS